MQITPRFRAGIDGVTVWLSRSKGVGLKHIIWAGTNVRPIVRSYVDTEWRTQIQIKTVCPVIK